MSDELHAWSRAFPHKVAWRLADGTDELSYRDLDVQSNQTAQYLIGAGLCPGDVIAICLPNCSEFFVIAWAARRLGLYYTPISVHLRSDEVNYILEDCGAKALFSVHESESFSGVSIQIAPGERDGPYSQLRSRFADYAVLPAGSLGKDFVYSSGTTGRPKGVKRPLFADPEQERRQADWIQAFSQHDSESICLATAPLYHAAPLRFAMRAIQHGGTVVGMRKFQAAEALAAVERWRVTHGLWVPTMFYRLLNLSDDQRKSHDLNSMRCAIHSGGPCAADLKQRMIAWWGPIIWEYYAASEGNGATCISSEEALLHPGSVGRAALGTLHVVSSDGSVMPVGQTGDIYFSGGPSFVYHNDPDKTAEARNGQGWTTVGDIGHLDSEGYLYLSDRKAHTIISGGVNIYPLEVEQLLCRHPAVADAAVFGIPNAEYGEEVKAVVELLPDIAADTELAAHFLAYCRNHLSSVKCPKSISFEARLPRGDNGKLSKVALKQRYSAPAADRGE